jgi:hypothetical protein
MLKFKPKPKPILSLLLALLDEINSFVEEMGKCRLEEIESDIVGFVYEFLLLKGTAGVLIYLRPFGSLVAISSLNLDNQHGNKENKGG